MTFDESLSWLYGTQSHGIKLGLDSARRIVRELGVTFEGMRFLHVAGTNGKGSVCAMLDSVCRAAGLRTGLYTSPHLVTFRERIRVDGEMIPESAVAEGLSQLRAVAEKRGPHPTFFEITTALALDFFAKSGVDVVILETGMGGRLDATSVVTPLACGITPVGLDHQAYLGGTLAGIAREKAGIIKPGVPVISAPQEPEAAVVIRDEAERLGAPLDFIEAPLDGLQIGLRGRHQAWNAALAVAMLEAAKIEIPAQAVREGLRDVRWPGRFQILEDGTVLDGAHNAHAARCLVQTWREVFGDERPVIVFAALADKNVADMATVLCGLSDCFIATQVGNPRSASAEVAAVALRKAGVAHVKTTTGTAEAIELARREGRRVLVTGSLFLVGEALAELGSPPMRVERSAQ